MSLLEQLRKDNMQALKNKDSLKKDVCGLLISSIALAQKEKGEPLTLEEELTYVQKELKQTKETLSLTPENRPELIQQTQAKIDILNSYLPKQMSAEEVREVALKIMEEKGLAKEKKSQGIIIKEIMAQYKGKTDGKTVSSVVGQLLAS